MTKLRNQNGAVNQPAPDPHRSQHLFPSRPEDISLSGKVPPLVSDSKYQARYLGHDVAKGFSKVDLKCYLYFGILGPADPSGPWEEDYPGTILFSPYNVRPHASSKLGWNAPFCLSKGQKLFLDLHRVGMVDLKPQTSVPIQRLGKVLLEVSTTTVLRNNWKEELPDSIRYSRVDRLTALLQGVL